MLTLTSEAEVSQRLYRGKAMPGKGTLFIKISIISRQIGFLVMHVDHQLSAFENNVLSLSSIFIFLISKTELKTLFYFCRGT